MRRWIFGIIFIALCLVMAALAAWVYVGRHGARILEERLEILTGQDIQVCAVRPVLPLGILASDVSVGELLRIKQVIASIDLLALAKGELRVSTMMVDQAELTWHISADSVVVDKVAKEENIISPLLESSEPLSKASSQKFLDRLIVRDSELFVQMSDGRKFHFMQVNAQATELPLDGRSVRTKFSFSASLEEVDLPFVGNLIRGRGWVDVARRNMQVSAKAMDDNGHVGARVAARGVNNVCVVSGALRLQGGQQSQALGQNTGRVEDVVLGLLGATGSDIGLRFVFRTALDRFKIEKVYLVGQITTLLNSNDSSSNIVQSLKDIAAQMLPQ